MTDQDRSLSGIGELAVAENVAYRIVQREAVAVDLVGHEVLALNEVAARFLDLIAHGATALAAVDVIEGEYEVERAVLEADILALIDELVELGVLTRPSDPAP